MTPMVITPVTVHFPQNPWGAFFDVEAVPKGLQLRFRADVLKWCQTCLSTLPELDFANFWRKPFVTTINFANDADAVAFTLRWSDEFIVQ